MPFAALAVIVAAAALGAVAYLRAPLARRDPAAQRELEEAAARVDRELAADLELMSMFDQTKRAFVLENGQFLAVRGIIERVAPEAYRVLADLYERIPATEAAMERRGPAGTIADADRILVQDWEGDAREAQRVLRAAARPQRISRWERVTERLRAR